MTTIDVMFKWFWKYLDWVCFRGSRHSTGGIAEHLLDEEDDKVSNNDDKSSILGTDWIPENPTSKRVLFPDEIR